MMEDVRWLMEDTLLFEKKQKVMFIFLAQEKGTKRTSTLTHPLPIWRGSNSELQKPTVLRAFWYRGTTRWEMRETPTVPPFRGKTYIRHQPSAISHHKGDGGCSRKRYFSSFKNVYELETRFCAMQATASF